MAVTTIANDRFKQGFGNWFWGSLLVAAVLHFLMFAFWPEMSTADVSFTTEELEAIELPPEVEIPPPPEQIARPATPVISDAVIDEDVTIASTTFEDNPIENLPPPPTASANEDLSAAPRFTPFTVRPELRNRAEVARALERNYPPLLRDAGIGGETLVWFFIDENGRVQKTQINKSSGYEALDKAALTVAEQMQFSPALNRDKKVPVWVAIPIVFSAK
ncbi:MAG: energy transducer TonB [Candidatus Cloacimonetes bacterium]|nr:energy transducer TonB [Candidatus Cloacimonadota bacterium]